MKIKLTTSLSGANGSWSPGDDYECDKDEANSLIDAGYAVAIEEAAPVDKAENKPEGKPEDKRPKVERAVIAPASDKRTK